MLIFPHNTSTTLIDFSTSASLAATASFLDNFASIPINSASLALNFSGSAGTAGTNYTKVGATGSVGIQGEQGYRGDNIYVLAVGWSKTTPSVCTGYTDFGTYTFSAPSDYICSFGPSVTYYSTSSITIGGPIDDGTILYYDSSCASPVANLEIAYSNKTYTTNGSGVTTVGPDCGVGV